jgi:hypothetical protein
MIQIEKYTKNYPLVCLVAANLVPLYGVAFADWDAFSIVLLYWAENLIIGFYNVLKIVFVKVSKPSDNLGKLFTIPFFMLHYGGFCAVHGLFILVIFGKDPKMSSFMNELHLPCFLIFFELLYGVIEQLLAIVPPAFIFAAAALFISHGISFVYNYILKGEYLQTNAQQLMGSPYGRIMIMHIAIIAGAFLTAALHSPVSILIVLVVLKTIIDIKMHLRERRKFASAVK